MDFSERLKNLRKQAGLTQSDFALKTGVHFQTVSKWERGNQTPDIGMLGIIASVLGVSLEKLLGEEESETPITGNFELSSMANAIADYRKHAGLSQAETAEKLGVSSDIISKWEHGNSAPDIDLLIKTARLFGVSVSVLYYGITKDYTPEKQVFYSKNRRKGMIISAVCLSVALIILSVTLLLLPKQKSYEVTVDGEKIFSVQGGSLFTPPTPEKSGYRFVNWVNEQGEEVQTPLLVDKNVKLLARFEVVEYDINYWLNGGEFKDTVQTSFTVESGEIVLAIPVKGGEAFMGWYLTNDYSGESVSVISCECLSINLYAKWQNVVYTINYDLGGGAVITNPQTVTKDEEVTLNNPTKNSYRFLGWYTLPNGKGERVEKVGGSNACNLVLYALWQKVDVKYNVTYLLNGGSVENGENATLIAEGETKSLVSAQKVGHNFIGWCDEEDGSGNYYQWITGEKDLTLYAIFAPKNYTVRYEYKGVYQEEANPSFITYGEEIKLNALILEGHDFIGWYDSEQGGNKIDVINKSNIEELTVLYARFTPKVYQIKLMGNNGEFLIDGKSYTEYILSYEYGTIFNLPICEKQKYTFLYWADIGGESYSQINSLNYHFTVLYAHFFVTDGCEINYVTDDGFLIGDAPERFYAGEKLTLPKAEKDGYVFLGWNENAEGTGKWYTVTPDTDKEILDLYAIYQDVVIGADGECFRYEMTATQVTITKYIGDESDNINIVIPDYIEGLPVTKISAYTFIMDIDNPENYESHLYINSLTLPSTLREIEDNGIDLRRVNEPVVIPASVYKIGVNAFKGVYSSIVFEKNSALTILQENAFGNCFVLDVFEVPEGVQEICSYSLPYNAMGYILPQSLQKVHSHAYGISATEEQKNLTIYLPNGVKEVGKYPFGTAKIYSDISPETIESFNKNWCYNFAGTTKEYTLTLKDEEKTLSVTKGVMFNLPYIEKQGYNFVGWQRADGSPVCKAFINEEFSDITLYAVYSKAGLNDGTSPDNPITLEVSNSRTFSFSACRFFYLSFDALIPYCYDFYGAEGLTIENSDDNYSSTFSNCLSTKIITSEYCITYLLRSYGYVTHVTISFVHS